MKRPLVVFSVMYMAGVVLAHEFCSINPIIILAIAMMFIVTFGACLLNCRIWILFTAVVFFLAGGAVYSLSKSDMEKKVEPITGKYVQAEGFIDEAPVINEYGSSLVLKVVRISDIENGRSYEVKFRTQVRVSSCSCTDLKYGEGISIVGKVVKPEPARNPGGFDNKLYLAQKKISSIMYVLEKDIRKTGINGGNIIIRAGYALRNSVIDIVNRCLPAQHAALLKGMLIGYRDDMETDMENAFRDSGLVHIIAVSGMHVAFLVFPLIFVFKRLGIPKVLSNLMVMIVLSIFLCVTGFRASVIRAVIMVDVVLIAQMIRRETDIYTSIGFSALIMLLYNPFLFFNIGFQLSYAATVSICLFCTNFKRLFDKIKLPNTIKDTLAGTVSAQLGILPLSALYFNSISLISLVSNLIVVPLMGVITVTGMLMTLVGSFWMLPAHLLSHVNYSLLSIVLNTARISSGIPFAVKTVPTPSLFFIVSYYFFLLVFVKVIPRQETRKKRYKVFISAVIVIVTMVSLSSLFSPQRLKVVFIDVGNADSIYIRTPDNTRLLIDGGSGGRVVQCLLYYGALKLDAVFATHDHSDHIGGLPEVFDKLKVKNLMLPGYTYQPEFASLAAVAEEKGTGITTLNAGDVVSIGKDLRIEVLHPRVETTYTGNNGSLTFRLVFRDVSILFTGDIELEAERTILDGNWDINSNLIKVAHHGSKTSSSLEFLQRVKPDAAVISAGGSKNHPSDIVVERLEQEVMHVFRTDTDGAVILQSDGRNIRIKKWLQ